MIVDIRRLVDAADIFFGVSQLDLWKLTTAWRIGNDLSQNLNPLALQSFVAGAFEELVTALKSC